MRLSACDQPVTYRALKCVVINFIDSLALPTVTDREENILEHTSTEHNNAR